MRKAICVLLIIALMVSFTIPSFATEVEEPKYGAINVEYSDSLGSIDHLDVMVQGSHVFADANMLCEKLGYKCRQEGNIVSIYADNNFFYHEIPLISVHYEINSTNVAYNPMFGAEYSYTAPAPCIKNDKGIWVPLQYTLVLLGGNSTLLADTLLIQVPRENVLSIAAMIANNDTLLSFDWIDDFGYSETATNVASGAGRLVTLFSGLLEFDGDAWLSLIDWSAFDKKFGKSLAMMFSTNASEELQESIEQVETLLAVFSPDGQAGQMLHNKQLRIDSDVTAWKTACEEYLELLADGSGSPTKYNLLYRQYERVLDDKSLFNSLGGDDIIYIQDELSSATNVLDVASKIGSAVSYFSEFQKKDDYQISVLKKYLNTRTYTDKLPDATAEGMLKYISSTNGAGQYLFSRFLEEHALELIVDKSGLDAYLGGPANILLLAWDIMSEVIPFYSDGLGAVEQREISNYAQKVQNDAFYNLTRLMASLKTNATISVEDCVQLSEYCYVYLKASYIARSAAVASLDSTSKKFQEQIEGKLANEAEINQIIAQYLATLSSADRKNTCYILGFLPENNEEYLKNFSDANLLSVVKSADELSETNSYDDILSMYHTSISCNWNNCDGEASENVGDPDNACYIFSRYESNRSLEDVGYALLDINDDGESELFISMMDIADSGAFYDMYTISNGKLVHVITAGERDRYNLAEDLSINNNGSGSASTGREANYGLDSTNGKLQVNHFIDYDYNREPHGYYTTVGYFSNETHDVDSATFEPISKEKSFTILDSFPENVALVLTPFSEYRRSGGDSVNNAAIVATGDCGNALTWTLHSDGTLIISGNGEMTSYFLEGDEDTLPPWMKEDVEVTKVVFDGKITSIGNEAFCFTSIQKITIPASVTEIYFSAFEYIDTLEKFYVDSGNTIYVFIVN